MLDTVVITPPTLVETGTKEADTQILKVYYKDNTFKSYDLPVDVMSSDVCTKFAIKFLRISERAASHFSLHLVMQGIAVKQLKPTDKPIKIQKELNALGYKFNTAENDNYFLFTLKEETKSSLNDYCERNSLMMMGPPRVSITPADSPKREQRLSANGRLGRTQSMLALMPSKTKERLSSLKRKVASVTKRKDTNKDTSASPQLTLTPTSPASSTPTTPSSEGRLSVPRRDRRSTTPDLPSQSYPSSPPPLPTPSTPQTPQGNNESEPTSPVSLTASWSPSSPKLRPNITRLPTTRNLSVSAPCTPRDLPNPPSPKLYTVPTPDLTQTKSLLDSPSPMKRSAGEDLEAVIDQIFGAAKDLPSEEEDVEKMMDHIFDWYPASSSATETQTPTTTTDSGEDFNEILDALHQLSNA